MFGQPECFESVTVYSNYHIRHSTHTQLYERESVVPKLSTHVLLNMSTWYTFGLQKPYHRALLLGEISKFHCCFYRFIATLSLCMINSLALSVSYMTQYNTAPLPLLTCHFKMERCANFLKICLSKECYLMLSTA